MTNMTYACNYYNKAFDLSTVLAAGLFFEMKVNCNMSWQQLSILHKF